MAETLRQQGTTELGPYHVTWYADGWALVTRPDGRAAVAHWSGDQWTGPVFGAPTGSYYHNGWTATALDYVTSWVHPSTARQRLRVQLGLA